MSMEKYAALVHRFLHWYDEKGAGLDIPTLKQRCLEEKSMRIPFLRVLEADSEIAGKVRIGEKTPLHSFFVDYMYDMFPDALFINIIRDPRAVVASMNRLDLFTDDCVINAYNWRAVMRKGRTVLHQVVAPEQIHELKFEDLVVDPEKAVRAACSFIGEQYEEKMLSYHEAGLAHVSSRSPEWGTDRNLSERITPRAARTWTEELSSLQVQQIEWVCRTEMAELGYVAEEAPLSPWQTFSAAGKIGYCAAKRIQNRDRRSHLITYLPLQRIRRRLSSGVSV